MTVPGAMNGDRATAPTRPPPVPPSPGSGWLGPGCSLQHELKSAFLTAVSHELRTPVTTILGNAKTLQLLDGAIGDGERAELVDAIAGRASGLTRLISDLLDVERMSHGAELLRREKVSLGTVIERATDSFVSQPAHRLELAVDDVSVEIDALKAERIIENLGSNAFRHTPPGTPVSLRARAEDRGVHLTVEDGGPGVPEELRTAVFEPFRQLDSGTNPSPGVGIGLALVKRFAELHGGRAGVETSPAGGAAFHVFLPCEVEPAVAEPADPVPTGTS